MTTAEVLFAGPVANFTAAAAASTSAQGLCVGASGNFGIPIVWAGFWPLSAGVGKLLEVSAAGVVTGQATATTVTIGVYLSSTLANVNGTTLASATQIASSGAQAVTSVSGAAWLAQFNITSRAAGYGTTATSTSLLGFGQLNVAQTTGTFAANLIGAVGGPTSATNIDASVNQYLGIGATFSTSSATNSCTLEQLIVAGMN